MTVELRAFYLPFIFISFIIGYQMSFFFLYYYYRHRERKIELNKILLYYGIFFGLSITGCLFDIINDFYITNIFIKDIFARMVYALVLIASVLILYHISSKVYKEIINPTLTKILIFMNIFPFISIFIFNPATAEFHFAIIFISIDFLFFLIFQLNLIRLSSGNIKKRLKIIFLGALIIISAIIIGFIPVSELTTLINNPIIAIPFITTLSLGLIILLLGALRFPVFLEFFWKQNLISLFIINRKTLKKLYSYNFTSYTEDMDNSKKSLININESIKFISHGMIGIIEIFTAVAETKDKKIKQIKQGGFSILLEYGEDPISNIFFVLLVKGEMDSNKYFLTTIKNQFQWMYKHVIPILEFLDGSSTERIFSSFDTIMKNILKMN